MKVLAKEQCVLEYSATNPPVLTVAPGEMFQLQIASTLTHPEAFPHKTLVPVIGPIYVEGAKPGSALKVDIIKIELTAGKGAIMTIAGRGAFAQPNILKQLYISKFDSQNPLHLKLAELSEKAHYLAAASQNRALSDVEEEIDHLAGELWGLSEDELTEIEKSLDEIS